MNNYENNNQPVQPGIIPNQPNPTNEQPIEPQNINNPNRLNNPVQPETASNQPNPINEQSPIPQNQEINIEQPKKKKNPIIIIIIIGLIIIAGVIVFLKFFNNKELNNNTTNNTNETATKNNNSKNVVKTDWRKFEFSIDGVKKQLPLTLEELMDGLPEGWEYYKESKHSKYISYKLSYYGSDKSLDSFILFWVNQETNLIYWISPAVDYCKEGKRTGFEINGIKEGATEKETLKLLGTPGKNSFGKLHNYREDLPKDTWSYFYYINNENINDGYLNITDLTKNDNRDKVTQILLYDKKHEPNY